MDMKPDLQRIPHRTRNILEQNFAPKTEEKLKRGGFLNTLVIEPSWECLLTFKLKTEHLAGQVESLQDIIDQLQSD